MFKYFSTVFMIMVIVLIGVGCSPPPPPEDAIVLRINYENQADFNARYGNFIRSQIPELVFEVVPSKLAEKETSFADFVKNQQLDIVLMNYNDYVELVDQELLIPLHIEDINGFETIPDEFLFSFRMKENTYYGLPTDFLTPAIFYNYRLFDQYQIPYPTDQMTWEEVYQLARQFPKEPGLHPFYGGPAEYVLQNIALTLGGKIYTSDMQKLRLGEEPWKQAWMLTTEAYSNASFKQSQIGFEEFVIGRTAMYYDNASAIEPMREKSNSVPVEVVTQPVHSDTPDEFPLFYVNIFGITKSSNYASEAWQAIKWIDELTFQLPRGNVPSRVKEWEKRYEIDLSAIYKLHLPVWKEDINNPYLSKLPDDWNQQWQLYHQPIFKQYLQGAIEGDQSSEQAYQQFVQQSNEAWAQFLAKHNNN